MDRSYKIKPIHASMRLDRWIKNNIGASEVERAIRLDKLAVSPLFVNKFANVHF